MDIILVTLMTYLKPHVIKIQLADAYFDAAGGAVVLPTKPFLFFFLFCSSLNIIFINFSVIIRKTVLNGQNVFMNDDGNKNQFAAHL